MSQQPRGKRMVEIVPSTYSPTKAELEEEFRIDATPEQLAKSLLQPVELREKSQPKRRKSG